MAQKRISELPVGSAPTGTELVPVDQAGTTVSLTAQQIANLGVATNEISTGTITTASGTLTIDFGAAGIVAGIYRGLTSFATAKAVVLANDSTAVLFEFTFEITNVAATLDFGSGSVFQSTDARFNTGTQVLTLTAIGTFTVTGRLIGSNWWLEITPAVASGGASDWGDLGGTITDQTDLVSYVASIADAKVIDSIADSDTTHAPSRNSVFDALALKLALAGGTMGGNIAMGSNKVTGLAAASGNGEAVRFEQLPAASSETVSGLIEIATQAEVTTGTDDVRAVTPLKLKVATIGVQDLFISAAAMWPRTTGPCADLTRTELATSLFNIQSLDFDQTTQEFAQFQIVLPRKYNNGTVTAVFYWTAAAGSGDVQWGISGGAYSNDDALTVALGSAQTADDTLITANDLHISPATSAVTLAGTPADADFLAFQISRNPASDTLTADAKLLGVSIRITTDAGTDA